MHTPRSQESTVRSTTRHRVGRAAQADAGERLKRDRLADLAVHMVGVAFALSGSVAIAATFGRLDLIRIASLAVYVFGLLGTFGCSALYNLTEKSRPHSVFRRLDHAAIFVMIAGTYTPLTVSLLPADRGLILLSFVWTGAIAGALAKLIFPARFERSSIVAYLLLGWAILGAVGPLYRALPTAGLVLLAAGGMFYSFGVIFHVRKQMPYQNALWHACVLAGAACHFALIFRFVALA